MSALQHYTLYCDGHDATIGCCASFTVHARRADITRVHAAQQGWVHGVEPPNPHRGGPTKSLDYCAKHAAQLGARCPKTLPEHARAVDS